MLQTAFSIIFLAGFVFIGALLLRRFVFSTQWFLSDMYFVALLAAVPLGFIFTGLNPSAVGMRESLQLMLLCTGCEFPIVIGAWWGLNSAKRLGEVRAIRRYGLIVACVFSILGILGLIAAFIFSMSGFMHLGRVEKPLDTLMVQAGSLWVGAALLLLPGVIVEAKCREVEQRRRK